MCVLSFDILASLKDYDYYYYISLSLFLAFIVEYPTIFGSSRHVCEVINVKNDFLPEFVN